MYEFHFEEILARLPFLLDGVKVTVLVTSASVVVGLVLGLFAALARLTELPVLGRLAALYVDFFRTTPLFVQLVWIFLVLPLITGWAISPFASGVLALSLYGGAYFAEIYRSGIRTVERGQWHGALALGMTYAQMMRRVILPQAIVRMLPPFVGMFVALFKESAVVSAIGVADLTRQSLALSAMSLRPFEVMTVMAGLYLMLTYPQTVFVNYLYRRLLSH